MILLLPILFPATWQISTSDSKSFWRKNMDGQLFLYLTSTFCRVLQFLRTQTFCVISSSPKFIFAMHLQNGNSALPAKYIFWLFSQKKNSLCWALLSGKSQLHYDYLFSTLCQKTLETLETFFLPKLIKSVFKTGFIAVANNIFGKRAIHKGWYFHLNQAIYIKIQLVGLTTAYKKFRISKNFQKNSQSRYFAW